jgi:hypothetical protein
MHAVRDSAKDGGRERGDRRAPLEYLLQERPVVVFSGVLSASCEMAEASPPKSRT